MPPFLMEFVHVCLNLQVSCGFMNDRLFHSKKRLKVIFVVGEYIYIYFVYSVDCEM